MRRILPGRTSTKTTQESPLNPLHSDRLVAKRLLTGDDAAFRDVFDAYFPRLYRYALGRVGGNQEDAREVVQQTFCKAFERLDTYRGEASLYAWMCQICRHIIIDAARHRQNAGWRVESADADATVRTLIDTISGPATEQPDSMVSRMDLAELIQMTLDCLPARYGDVLEWKYVDELSVQQIAAQLSIGPKAVESLLTRARRAFREAIATVGDSADVVIGGGRSPAGG